MAGVRAVLAPQESADDAANVTNDSKEESTESVSVNVELTPMCTSALRHVEAAHLGAALASNIERVVNGSGVVDPASLESSGEGCTATWTLEVDAYVLDHDGNLADATMLAVLAALSDTSLPGVEMDPEGKVLIQEAGPGQDLIISTLPVPLTFAVADGQFLADPTFEEEQLCTHAVTVVIDQDGVLSGVNKVGGVTVTDAQLQTCIEQALERSKFMCELIQADPTGSSPMDI